MTTDELIKHAENIFDGLVGEGGIPRHNHKLCARMGEYYKQALSKQQQTIAEKDKTLDGIRGKLREFKTEIFKGFPVEYRRMYDQQKDNYYVRDTISELLKSIEVKG